MRMASIYKVGDGFAMTYQYDDGRWNSELHRADGSTIDLRIYKTEEGALKMAQKRLGDGVELLGTASPFSGSLFIRQWLTGCRPGQWALRTRAVDDVHEALDMDPISYVAGTEGDAWRAYDAAILRRMGKRYARKCLYALVETDHGLYDELLVACEEFHARREG